MTHTQDSPPIGWYITVCWFFVLAGAAMVAYGMRGC
jgi:hypothetical protein